MESWQKGRGELFDELTKICNRIETDISSELNDTSTTRLGIDELQQLRETSDRVERLTEQNARLADELERYREASSRVDVLEKENKRLAEELAGGIQLGAISTAPAPFTTPGPSRITTSTPRFTPLGTDITPSRTVPWEQHRSLIEKYNKVVENWVDMKASRDRLERQLRIQKQNTEIWKESYEEARRLKEKKDVKYKKLKGENEDFRARLNLPSGSFSALENDEEILLPPSFLEHEPVRPRSPNEPISLNLAEDLVDMPSFSASESMNRPPQNDDHYPPLISSPRLPVNTRHGDLLMEDTESEATQQPPTSSTQDVSDPVFPQKFKEETYPKEPMPPEIPVVISPRSVEKRKQRSDVTESTTASRVKIEISSSSPIPGLQYSNVRESIDLDDIGEKVDTPRKQQRTTQLSYQDDYTSYAVQNSNQEQVWGHGSITSYSESRRDPQITPNHRIALQSRSVNECVLLRTSVERPSKRRRIIPDRAIAGLAEDSEFDVGESERRQSSELSDRLLGLLERPSPKSQVLNARSPDLSQEKNRVTSGLAREVVASAGHEYKVQQAVSDIAQWKLKAEKRPWTIFHHNILNTLDLMDSNSREIASFSFSSETIRMIEMSKYSSILIILKSGHTDAAIKIFLQLGDIDECLRFVDNLKKIHPTIRLIHKNPDYLKRCLANAVAKELDAPKRVFSRENHMGQTAVEEKSGRVLGNPSRQASGGVNQNLAGTPRPTSKGSMMSLLETPRLTSSRGLLHQNAPDSPVESGYFSASTRGSTSVSKTSSRPSPRQSAGSTKPSPGDSHLRRVNVASKIDPGEEPLRARPLSRLGLPDFKVNPNYNQGYKYAFTEVVRGAEARKCLQGCTKPDCCGPKFRALAEASRNPSIPPTLSQEQRDEALLQEFMGRNAYKIQNMSEAEREETLLQAKTRDLANKLGRHRHAYERKASPPGFWRVDFPTTQEQEEDRERAKEQERATVAQRYAEAMRPDGAYKFRDE